MDNLTHSLLGAVVGETLARFVPAARGLPQLLPESVRCNLYVSLMVVGSNLPDLDSLYTGITGGKLGYLLHHRGHTHTVLGALAIALLMYAVCLAWLRWRQHATNRYERRWLVVVVLLAPLLHLAMDWTNEYGVHPFWPLNNAWLYGDRIFIIEPLFWAAAAPLVFLLQRRAARLVVALILLLGIGLSFGTGFVPRVLAFGLTLFTLVLLLIGWRAPPRLAASSALAASVGVIVLFVVAGGMARSRVERLVTTQYPDTAIVDLVLAPLPVNPFCWDLIAIQTQDDAYTLRQALFTLAPGWFPSTSCRSPGSDATTTLRLEASSAVSSTALHWLNDATLSRAEGRMLLDNHCEAAAFAGFARALWFRRNDAGWLVGDLRYDREPGLGFAELQVAAEPQQCPRFVPPWTPPRAALFSPRQSG